MFFREQSKIEAPFSLIIVIPGSFRMKNPNLEWLGLLDLEN